MMPHQVVEGGAAFVHSIIDNAEQPTGLDVMNAPLPPELFEAGIVDHGISAAYWRRGWRDCETPSGEPSCRCGHFTLEWRPRKILGHTSVAR